MDSIAPQIAVIGLAKSGVIALLAVGIVLIYRTTGVVNLAHWAMGLIAVVTYVLLTQVEVPPVLAALLSVAVAIAAAVLTQRVVFSKIRRGDQVLMVLVSLGVGALLAAFAQMALRQQRGEIIVEPFLPGDVVRLGSAFVTWAEIVTVLTTVAVAATLLPWLRRSRTGRALRAVAQNPDAAQLAGIDAKRCAELAWAIGSALAAVALLLLIPHSAGSRGGVLSVVHLVPLGSLLIPALGAALVGGLVSLPAAIAGSLVFGLVQELLVLVPGPVGDERDLLAFLAITVLLLLRTERFFASRAELEALRS